MKALRLTRTTEPLVLESVPTPAPGPFDVLVKVEAAGICHSDVHYRNGTSAAGPLPLTPGHEVAGVVAEAGAEVRDLRVGDRVALHYLVTCGACRYCRAGREQFCTSGAMIGKHRDGGYAEYILVPARNAVPVPPALSLDHAAVMMCSTATSFHALRKSRLAAGETVAVFGVGGLGLSAVQLARAFGALTVYAVDIHPAKLALAEGFGAVPVNASEADPVTALHEATDGRGVDVALELIGLPITISQAVRSVGVFGRATLAGISGRAVEIDTYPECLGKETEIIGVSDHLLSEIYELFDFAVAGRLDLSEVVTASVTLDADAVNGVLDELESYAGRLRTVIHP
jgi:propanol-preferring alcohol dehydrogenase